MYQKDELLWAAAWLYKASGGSKYLKYITDNQGWNQAASEFSWDNKFVGVQTLLIQVSDSPFSVRLEQGLSF